MVGGILADQYFRGYKMREFIISIYEWILAFVLVACVALGFYYGYDMPPYDSSVRRGLFFAAIGFVFGVSVVGHCLTVISMKETAERQARRIAGLEGRLDLVIAEAKKRNAGEA
ncbi:hypothetical protein D9M68_931970 [compost metagenome]